MPQRYYRRTGKTFVGLSGHVYDIYEVREVEGSGLGIVPVLIAAGVQIGTALIARSGQPKPPSAQVEFDAFALQVNQVFHAIQTKPAGTVTAADLQAAEQLFAQLQEAVQRFPQLAPLWNSEHYRPAYENGLRRIREMVAANPQAYATGGSVTSATAGQTVFGLSPVVLIAIFGVLIFMRR